MIARLTPYRTAEVDEIVARARAGSPGGDPGRRLELFFLDRKTGSGLSLVIGEDEAVRPVIELDESGEPEEYDVRLLQVGGPEGSGIAPTLLGRIVRSEPTVGNGLTDRINPVPEPVVMPPSSTAVWTRGWLADGSRQVAFAVATDAAALEAALPARDVVVDYDDVAYHFLRH